MTCNRWDIPKKMSEMEVSKNETCLWKIKCCGSSTVTINKQKHIHKNYTMVNIFSSGCYVPYIYNSCTTSLSQASPVFDLLLFRSTRPFYTRPLRSFDRSAVSHGRWLPHLNHDTVIAYVIYCMLGAWDRGYNACESDIVSKCVCLMQNAWVGSCALLVCSLCLISISYSCLQPNHLTLSISGFANLS